MNNQKGESCPDLPCVLVTQSCPTLRPHGLWPTRLLCPRNSLDKNTGEGCHFSSRGSSWPGDRTQVPALRADSWLSESLVKVGRRSVASTVSAGCFPSDFTYWLVLKLFPAQFRDHCPRFPAPLLHSGWWGHWHALTGVVNMQRKAPKGPFTPRSTQASAGSCPAAVRTQGHAGHHTIVSDFVRDCVFNLRCTWMMCVTRIISLQSRGDHVTLWWFLSGWVFLIFLILWVRARSSVVQRQCYIPPPNISPQWIIRRKSH